MLWLKRYRRKRIASRQFPLEWRVFLEQNTFHYNKLPEGDKKQLCRDILIFLAEKRFEACGGLALTEEMKLTIAALACVLLLRRETDYFPGLYSILVYPTAYVANHTEHLGSGVVAEGPEVRLGESWHRGSVVLSWEDVSRAASDKNYRQNVVFHEFAHQLDTSAGMRDSSPILRNQETYDAWLDSLEQHYEELCDEIAQGRPTLLGNYAASNPAEFFAVATEIFFQQGETFRETYPDLYEQLKLFYNQDPAEL
jgi:hypothetical protein